MIEPKLLELMPKKLVGINLEMSLADNKTQKLWQTFMPRLSEVENRVGTDFFSLQVFPENHFRNFSPTNRFTKWALVEVSGFDTIPSGMESFELEGGKYAVFHLKGMDMSIFQYIYGEWIHQSEYSLDNRPHFEVLGEKYKNGSPDSEEYIYIPIN
jgi:AraC family transcriptional regulator